MCPFSAHLSMKPFPQTSQWCLYSSLWSRMCRGMDSLWARALSQMGHIHFFFGGVLMVSSGANAWTADVGNISLKWPICKRKVKRHWLITNFSTRALKRQSIEQSNILHQSLCECIVFSVILVHEQDLYPKCALVHSRKCIKWEPSARNTQRHCTLITRGALPMLIITRIRIACLVDELGEGVYTCSVPWVI